MKWAAPLSSILAAGVLCSGCLFFHHHRPAPAPASTPAAANAAPIVTPDASLTARVVSYNAPGRFVVLSFPVGQLPQMAQTLFLYRAGLKVGEVEITGPQRDNDIVADLVTGEAQVGDEVRDQ